MTSHCQSNQEAQNTKAHQMTSCFVLERPAMLCGLANSVAASVVIAILSQMHSVQCGVHKRNSRHLLDLALAF